MIYIGLDDTDNQGSRGTGQLARAIAIDLMKDYAVLGVTRHQLLVDDRIPYTSHNSSAAIHLDNSSATDLLVLFERVKSMMLTDFVPGSDPGLCMASGPIPDALIEFGRRAQREVVRQAEAWALAAIHPVLLAGLAGTQDGVIGSLAAIGLAASGEDGRYLQVGESRELSGLQEVSAVLQSGIAELRTLDGSRVEQGLVLSDKLRPARRKSRPILYVEWQGDHWQPIRLA
jgi:hypothetical protein